MVWEFSFAHAYENIITVLHAIKMSKHTTRNIFLCSTPVQAIMFMVGANSIFTGDRLLTTANPEFDADKVRNGMTRRKDILLPSSVKIPNPWITFDLVKIF